MTQDEIARNVKIATDFLNAGLPAPAGYSSIFQEKEFIDELEKTLQDNEFYLFTRDMTVVLNSLVTILFAPKQKSYQEKLDTRGLSSENKKTIKKELENITDKENAAYQDLQKALFLDPKLGFTLNNAGYWFYTEMCVKYGSCNTSNDKVYKNFFADILSEILIW